MWSYCRGVPCRRRDLAEEVRRSGVEAELRRVAQSPTLIRGRHQDGGALSTVSLHALLYLLHKHMGDEAHVRVLLDVLVTRASGKG